jgi:hypothetical protein
MTKKELIEALADYKDDEIVDIKVYPWDIKGDYRPSHISLLKWDRDDRLLSEVIIDND